MRDDSKRLYLDLVHLSSRYVMWNVDLITVVARKFVLSQLDIVLFIDIAGQYDSRRQREYDCSYGDLANKHDRSIDAIRDSIKRLCNKELIQRIGERKGRKTYSYIPNVELLHGLLREYANGKEAT